MAQQKQIQVEEDIHQWLMKFKINHKTRDFTESLRIVTRFYDDKH